MEINPILQNVLAPPVLFFLIGAISVLFKSDLEIPAPLPKLFSLYLLLAIGFKGGIEIQKSGFTNQVLPTLSAAILMSLVIPQGLQKWSLLLDNYSMEQNASSC